jgi:putative oxidoreductase
MSWHDLLRTRASGWVILIRLMVGLAVFFPEGIQKLIFPETLGAGRFTRIGIPFPDLMGPFVGVVEIVCGALIVVGLLTRLAAIPLIITMIVAIVSTKIPILLGHEFWTSICRNSTAMVSGARRMRAAPIWRCCWAACTC